MAAPVFHNTPGAALCADNVADPTVISPTAPTRSVGELLLYIALCRSNTATCTTPTGYTLITGFPVRSGTASGGTIYAFWRYATNDANDNPTCTWTGVTTGTSGDSSSATIVSYTNGLLVRDGIATATDTAATASWTMPATTTATANSLVFGISIKVSDTSQTSTITTFTERYDAATVRGTGHVVEFSDIAVASPGSSGTGTITPSNTTSSRVLAVSFGFLGGTRVPLGASSAISSTGSLTLSTPIALAQTTAYLTDNFTDADGTAVASHTADSGATWTLHPSYTTGAKITSNRVEGEGVTSGVFYSSATPTSADYDVEGVIRRVTHTGTMAIAARVSTSTNNFYSLTWGSVFGVGFWVVAKTVAGVVTTLPGGTYADAPADGTDRTGRLELRGTQITAYVDGVRIWQGTDSDISAAGRPAVFATAGSSTTGYHLDSITATNPGSLTASAQSSATLALTAQTAVPLGASSAVASATVALTAQTKVALEASSAVASATLAAATPMPVPLGASSAQSSATLNLAQYVPLSSSSSIASTSLALTAQTAIPLGASSALSSATLALTAKQPVVLGASSAQVSATLNLAQYVPLQSASAVSSATLALAAKTTVALGPSSAALTATLALTDQTTVALSTSSALSSATLALSAKTTVALGASSAQSSASLNLAQYVPLSSSSAVSSAALTVTTGTQVPLAASSVSSSTTLALTAPTQIPLGSASATASTSLAVTAGASTVPLAAASSTSSTTLALTATTQIPLGASSALASATLALTAKTTIALGASSAQSSASLAVTLPTPAILPLVAGNAQANATLAASAKTTAVLQSAGIQASATLALSAETLVVLVAATAGSGATFILTAPFFTPVPEWDQHTGTEWAQDTDSEWVFSPDVAEAALYPADDLYPDPDLYPSETVEGGEWEQSSDQEWILA